MPFSPELKVIPEIAAKFFKAGVAQELLVALYKGDANRSLIEDGRRVLNEFKKTTKIHVSGLENIKGGVVLTFNHPNMNVLFPGFLDLAVNIHDNLNREVRLVMASEIMLFAKLNKKKEFPGSIQFMERFHRLFGGAIISTPTVESRKDFVAGRAIALRKIFRELAAGNILAISPEGHVEMNGTISPIETFHSGSGAISRIAARRGIPTIPVGMWDSGTPNSIHIAVGQEFFPQRQTDKEAVTEIMGHIADLLPQKLRGPFNSR